MNEIREWLVKNKYNTATDETYSHILEWLEWYQNDVEKFHIQWCRHQRRRAV